MNDADLSIFCTCNQGWGGTAIKPPCPVHGLPCTNCARLRSELDAATKARDLWQTEWQAITNVAAILRDERNAATKVVEGYREWKKWADKLNAYLWDSTQDRDPDTDNWVHRMHEARDRTDAALADYDAAVSAHPTAATLDIDDWYAPDNNDPTPATPPAAHPTEGGEG